MRVFRSTGARAARHQRDQVVGQEAVLGQPPRGGHGLAADLRLQRAEQLEGLGAQDLLDLLAADLAVFVGGVREGEAHHGRQGRRDLVLEEEAPLERVRDQPLEAVRWSRVHARADGGRVHLHAAGPERALERVDVGAALVAGEEVDDVVERDAGRTRLAADRGHRGEGCGVGRDASRDRRGMSGQAGHGAAAG
jgi:hypothetical protein